MLTEFYIICSYILNLNMQPYHYHHYTYRSVSPESKNADLILDGEDLELLQLKISGVIIFAGAYKYEVI
jgi:hypothetical protein